MGERPALQVEPLRVAGGQRGEGTPPGIAVLLPPLRRARSREETAFLLLVDLGEAPSSLYRRLREVAAEAFWTSEGSVTAALRRAVTAANRVLFQVNLQVEPPGRIYGSLTCLAVRDEEVFLAQAGPAWACTLCGGLFEQFPQEDLPPLGTAAYAEVRLNYLTCGPGDTFLLGSSRLGRAAPADVLRLILSREMDALLAGLEQVGAEGDFSALVVRWPAEPVSVPMIVEEEAPAEPPPPPPKPAPRPPRRKRLPRARPTRAAGPPLRERLRAVGRRAAAWTVAAGRATMMFLRRMLPGRERMPTRPRRRERRAPPQEKPRLLAAIALAVLLVVAAATLWAWLTYGSGMRHREALAQAEQHAQLAAEATDPNLARGYWKAVLEDLKDVGNLPDAEALREQARAALDVLDRVRWVEPTLLWDFGADLRPRRLVVHSPYLFVLDEADEVVFQLSLDGTGDGVVEKGQAPVLVGQGEPVEQRAMGRPVDMVWAEAEGGRTAEGLLVLEEQGSLVVSDSWGIHRITLGAAPDQVAAVAMAFFDGRLYLLDPGANQVWRYLPDGPGYPHRPEPYFAAEAPHPLDTARDLAIDGSVYVLFEDGTVTKYYKGDVAPFEITGVPEPEPHFVALTVNPDQPDGPVILADAAGDRLVIVRADGAFVAQLRSQEGTFSSIQTVAMDRGTGRLYVLAGGRLVGLPAGIVP